MKYRMIFKDAERSLPANITVGDVTLKLKYSSEWDEWSVRVYHKGKYSEEETYYTDDKEDAIITMKRMAEDYKAQLGDSEATKLQDAIDLPLNHKSNTGETYKQIVRVTGWKIPHDGAFERISLEELKSRMKADYTNPDAEYLIMNGNDNINYYIRENRVQYSRFERGTSSLSIKGILENYNNDYAIKIDRSQPAQAELTNRRKERIKRNENESQEESRANYKQDKKRVTKGRLENLKGDWKHFLEQAEGKSEVVTADKVKVGDRVEKKGIVIKAVPVAETNLFVIEYDTGRRDLLEKETEVVVYEPLKLPEPNFREIAIKIFAKEEFKNFAAREDMGKLIKEMISQGLPEKFARENARSFYGYAEVLGLVGKDSYNREERVREEMKERLAKKNYRAGGYLTYTDKNGYIVDLERFLVKLAAKITDVPEPIKKLIQEVTELYNQKVEQLYVRISEAAATKDWSKVDQWYSRLRGVLMSSIKDTLEKLSQPKTYNDKGSWYEYTSVPQALKELEKAKQQLEKVQL